MLTKKFRVNSEIFYANSTVLVLSTFKAIVFIDFIRRAVYGK